MNNRGNVSASRRHATLRSIVALSIILAIAALWYVFAKVNQTSQEQRDIDAGKKLFAEGRLADAESLWRSVLRTDPDNPGAWEMLAKLNIATQNYGAAIDPLRHLAQVKPDTRGVFAKLAECLRRTGDQAGALEQAREALKRDPNDISALVTASLVLKQQDEGTQELVYERRLAQLRPNDPDLLRMLAGSLVQYGSYDEALPVLNRLIAVAPGNPNGYSLRGEVQYYLDQTPAGLAKAAGDFQRALNLAPNAYVPYLYLGRIYTRLKQPQKAIPYLLQAKRTTTARDDADLVLAEAYEMTGQKAQAATARQRFVTWREETDQEKELEKRLSLNPRSFDDNLRLGIIKLHKRELDAAGYYLAHALQLQPSNAEAKAAVQKLTSMANAAGTSPGGP